MPHSLFLKGDDVIHINTSSPFHHYPVCSFFIAIFFPLSSLLFWFLFFDDYLGTPFFLTTSNLVSALLLDFHIFMITLLPFHHHFISLLYQAIDAYSKISSILISCYINLPHHISLPHFISEREEPSTVEAKNSSDDENGNGNGHSSDGVTWQQSVESQLQLLCEQTLHRYLVPVFVTAVTAIPQIATLADPKGDRPNMADFISLILYRLKHFNI